MTPPLLAVRGMCKSFVGNMVLTDLNFAVRAGEVQALVGENGAGKSTLIKVLGGVYQSDRGEVLVEGEVVRLRSPRDARARGIVVIQQELSLAPHLSAAENIFLGHFPTTRFGTVARKKMHRRAADLLASLQIEVDPSVPVARLSIAQQQMVEIAKAISFEAKVLILDEPTAVLDEKRVATLFDLITRLKGQGLGIVFISHHLEEVFRICTSVTVLRDGRKTGEAPIDEVDQEWLVARMIGRSFPTHQHHARNVGQPALELHGLSRQGEFENISFAVHEGEIVGLAGLVGAGRTEIARSVVGLNRPDRGSVKLFGRKVRIGNPNAAARFGISYLTEDRKAQGLLPNRPVRENATIASLRRFSGLGVMNPIKERAYVRQMIDRLDVRSAGMATEIRYLSGGNQQKVLIGRALAVEPKILIVDEPTRGVDIGAKQEIYALIEQLVVKGMAIVLISSEMEEVLRLSDRIVVLRRGEVAVTLAREDASEAAIMRSAALAA